MYYSNIEHDTLSNNNFRDVKYTGAHLQVVLMSLLPQEEIGLETHHDNDQFFRFEEGQGKVVVNGKEIEVSDGMAVVIPAGSEHNIINTGQIPLKMYTIYAPAHHPDKTVHATKAEADELETGHDNH
jgi:mannose-6-phosphate isomerase-like protein (cupin superfamily)